MQTIALAWRTRTTDSYVTTKLLQASLSYMTHNGFQLWDSRFIALCRSTLPTELKRRKKGEAANRLGAICGELAAGDCYFPVKASFGVVAGLWAQGDKRNNARNGVPNVDALLPTLLMLTQHRPQWRASKYAPLFICATSYSVHQSDRDLPCCAHQPLSHSGLYYIAAVLFRLVIFILEPNPIRYDSDWLVGFLGPTSTHYFHITNFKMPDYYIKKLLSTIYPQRGGGLFFCIRSLLRFNVLLINLKVGFPNLGWRFAHTLYQWRYLPFANWLVLSYLWTLNPTWRYCITVLLPRLWSS